MTCQIQQGMMVIKSNLKIRTALHFCASISTNCTVAGNQTAVLQSGKPMQEKKNGPLSFFRRKVMSKLQAGHFR